MASKKIDISVEEIIASLKRSSLPTVLVEGLDDMIVYRALEGRLSHLGISIMPVGGRGKVLDVYSRRAEIPSSIKVAFIVDKDVWVHLGVPVEYVDELVIFTNGYSIENDVFEDGELWRLLDSDEFSKFDKDLREFVNWYALALSRFLVTGSESISLHPDHVLNPDIYSALIALKNEEIYPESLRQSLLENYKSMLRGKSLLWLVVRHTNYKGREPRHTDKALLQMVAIRPGNLLNEISRRLESVFA